MSFSGIKYTFTAKPWQYKGKGAWIFVSLPQKMSKEIRKHFKQEEEGWGRLKATLQIDSSEWKTAIWFDTKANTYMLPLKSEIRKKENVVVGKAVKVTVRI
jgi:hypothetical protein